MEVFRISKDVFSNHLLSSGRANRWNQKEQQVIYCGSSRSLSSLECIVHKGSIEPSELYKMMVISIADDDHLIRQIQLKELPANWRLFAAYGQLQKIGSEWYNKRESLLLKVPSVIIPYEYNFVINTEHPDFQEKVKLVRTESYFWDTRLL